MRRLLLVLANDVRRHLKSPGAILIYIAIPMVMTALIGIIFAPRTEGSELPPIQVLLVDNDKGFASKLLLGAFDADQMKKMFQVTVTDEADGRKRMERGRASAMIVIPEGFTLDLLDAKTTTLTVVKNPAEQFLPDVVEEFMNTLAVVLSGAVQAFADEARGIRAMLDGPIDSFPWEALGPELGKAQRKMVAAEKYLNPLLIRLKEEETKAAGAKTRFTQADLFSVMLPGMAVLLVMVALGTLIFRAKWGPFGYFLLLGAAVSFWTAAFFGFFHALVRNRNQAGALGAPIILAFSLFGGSMMNPEAMPKAFLAVGIATPNRWFIDGAALVRDGRFPAASLLVLAASGCVLAALAVRALCRRTSL